MTAGECVNSLPSPSGKYKRTMARLFALVEKTSGHAQGALERGEELVAMREGHLAAQAAKRSPTRRAR